MVSDDTYYITPHETALAVVATAMKKARLQLDTLIVNALVGGVLFSSGSIMCVAAHAENPVLWRDNPGLADSFSGVLFGIGLFYVVIMGADLFNSNILFFSVGVLRRAVSIYDLLVSWSVSLLGNIAGCLLVSYVFCHLSGVTGSELWKVGSSKLVEEKASFSFIQTFLKGIAGNFFVCLAIYLQLMAKPLHVKLFVIILPIFTFVSCGFTHAVADMSLSYIGMLNGGDVSVAKYIWKLLIPACVGNIIGGFAFSFVIPFYLHLIVVERDRKRLSLPEYEARDEQPELNTDSRVVRVSPLEEKEEELEAAEAEDDEEMSEKQDPDGSNSMNSNYSGLYNNSQRSRTSLESEVSPRSSRSTGSTASGESFPRPYTAPKDSLPASNPALSRTNTMRSNYSRRSSHMGRRIIARSPPGVFPVRGMGEPLRKEKTIENPNFAFDELPFSGEISHRNDSHSNIGHSLSRQNTTASNPLEHYLSHRDQPKGHLNESSREYCVLDDRPGARLEKAITRLVERKQQSKASTDLPRTTQDTFPNNRPELSPAYSEPGATRSRGDRGMSLGGLVRSMTKELGPRDMPSNVADVEKRMSEAGVTHKAAFASDNIAGIANYDSLDFPGAPPISKKKSNQSTRSGIRTKQDYAPLTKAKTASAANLYYKEDSRELAASGKSIIRDGRLPKAEGH